MIRFQTSEPEHWPQVVALADQAFGKGYLTNEIAETCSDFLIALDGLRVIGYVLNLVENKRGNIAHVVVHPDYRRHGIGTQLVQESVRIFASMGIPIVDSQAWERSDNKITPLATALEDNGFKRIEYLPYFYNEEHSDEVPCNVCGNVCVCGAWQYEKILL